MDAHAKMDRGGYQEISKSLNHYAYEDYMICRLATLPQIIDVEQLSARVLRVLGQNAGKYTLQGTNTYIVGTGDERIIIDTGQGVPAWAGLIETVLMRSSFRLSHVLLTHWHFDHVGGVPDLVRLCPGLSDSIYKHTPDKGQRPIQDGQVFRVEGATVRAVHAPGHSDDHMCFILEEEQAMFTGDNILGHGTSSAENLSLWMQSLRCMKKHSCKVGYPAHGMTISDLPARITAELQVRERREAKILNALSVIKLGQKATTPSSKGSATVQQLISTMYGTHFHDELRHKAIMSLTDEILRKLANDRKVAFERKSGQKRWFALKVD